MNQLTAGAFASADSQPLTRRALSKMRTRRQLLDAAKRLFNERGYDAATVREIAAAAGLSTGAVFASFSDKADLFGEVILDDCEALAEHLKTGDDHNEATETALLRLFSMAYAFHRDHLPLVQAAIGHSWTGEPQAARRLRGAARRVQALIDEVLRRGVARGELSEALDIRLTNEMIWDSFVANYRHAIFESWDDDALQARLGAQIKILLAGWRAAA
ncbi:MAG TPA: helix-turn-helix domain-containing protein [Caulobacteraceae bacterium]|jgi:AcrR family transcriptional regulator|nr:helix-turn-helix domain-containing protein [Caulobacteraceae bacterium]